MGRLMQIRPITGKVRPSHVVNQDDNNVWPRGLFGTQRDWVDAVRSTVAGLGYPASVTDDLLGGNLLRLLPARASLGGGA